MNQSLPSLHTLIIDDSSIYRNVLSSVLEEIPELKIIGTVNNGCEALEFLETHSDVDFITLDLIMPKMGGIQFLQEMRNRKITIPTVIISASSKASAIETLKGLDLGAHDFIVKPTQGNANENCQELLQQLKPIVKHIARKVQIRSRLASTSSAPVPQKVLSNAPLPNKKALPAVSPVKMEGLPFRSSPKVIAIGISTGGPKALQELLSQLPASLSLPIVIVQHMPPVFTEALVENLRKTATLSVFEGKEGERLKGGTVYIAPGGKQMKIINTLGSPSIALTDDPPQAFSKPSVDYLFSSLPPIYGDSILGIIMTGMGFDGKEGSRQLKAAGAVVIAQDEASCAVFGMPKAAFEAGHVDLLVPLQQIPRVIQKATGGLL